MRAGAIVQARMSSRRLPGKVLCDLAGKPLLERVVERVRLARTLDFVAIATSDRPDDDAIEEFCVDREIACHRGPLDDVLTRTLEAARRFELDPVVRITADCPFVCPELIDELVERLLTEGADYATLEGATLHEGIDPFSRRALETWNHVPLSAEEREHLALLPSRRPEGIVRSARAPRADEIPLAGVHLSVDRPHHLAFARSLYARLGGRSDFSSAELLAALTPNPDECSGGQVLARALRDRGIPRLYLYPGGTIMPTLNGWIELGGEFVVARHEQGAGYAALADARLNREPRVAMVTSGPGVTNLMTVIADAWYDSTPLIVIAGQVGTADLQSRPGVRQRGFQEVPTSALCGPITKACLRPMHADELPEIVDRAFETAVSGRPGPVVIELPMDVQRASVSTRSPRQVLASIDTPVRSPLATDPRLDEIAAWIRDAERPLMLAGQGVLLAGATDDLRALAEQERMPVVTSLLGVGAFPTQHALALGFLGHTGTPWANRAVHGCDLLLVLGSRLDVRQTGTLTAAFAAGARIVRIDLDPAELTESRIHADLSLGADVGEALTALLHALALRADAPPAREAWHLSLKTWRQELPMDDYPAGDGCHPAVVLGALQRATEGDEQVVVTGVGHHQQWAARHLAFDAPRRTLLTSGGHGAMGYDLPSTVGACLARPKARVLCIVGDGSFQINGQELGTLAEHRLPARIVVLDNRRLAMVSQFQKITWGHDPSTGDRAALDFAAMSAAYGVPCFRLERWDARAPTVIDEFLAVDGPSLLWVTVDPACEVSPMLLAGQTLDDLWTWNGS